MSTQEERTRRVYVGTAGWAVGKTIRDRFPETGSQLARYATHLNCCEINSTFYKLHRPGTYLRWIESVSGDFRFVLKAPKHITHDYKLRDCAGLLTNFLDNIHFMRDRIGTVLLFQLPPSLAFDAPLATDFFAALRGSFSGLVACEPRHPTWFEDPVTPLWRDFQIARVAADPARVPAASRTGGWPGLRYFRWHGSPRMYYSSYSRESLLELASDVNSQASDTICIFDNTALGEATANALDLRQII